MAAAGELPSVDDVDGAVAGWLVAEAVQRLSDDHRAVVYHRAAAWRRVCNVPRRAGPVRAGARLAAPTPRTQEAVRSNDGIG